MNSDVLLRKHVLNLLNGGMAYPTFDEIVSKFPQDKINKRFPHGKYNAWQLLEHIRLTQFATLDFMISQAYIELPWPSAYWPDISKKATKKDLKDTIDKFKKDRLQIEKLLMSPKIDLFSKVPNGTTQTFLREFLLIADHNSYHLGEFAIMRQVMKTWPKNHKD